MLLIKGMALVMKQGTVNKLRRQPEGEGGSANHQFLPIMPNMFAYEGGVKNSKNHAYVVYGRSLLSAAGSIFRILFSNFNPRVPQYNTGLTKEWFLQIFFT